MPSYLDRDFPNTKPLLRVMRKLTHKYIDNDTWEIIYASYYKWQPQQQLVDLI